VKKNNNEKRTRIKEKKIKRREERWNKKKESEHVV